MFKQIEKIKVVKLTETAKLPSRAHANDAGLDLYADEAITIKPQEQAIVKTGIKIAIPDNYVGLVWDKGGIAKQGIHTMAGVIDAGYRGEIIINLVNLSKKDYLIEQGQKIAQLLIQPISLCQIVESEIDDTTARGDGKHGSTGLY